jgi:hypothetical protein
MPPLILTALVSSPKVTATIRQPLRYPKREQKAIRICGPA